MENSQIGKIVLFLEPMPNWRIDPSWLYKNRGFKKEIVRKINRNKRIEDSVWFFVINDLYILF